ncbi:MAG TPA: neutral/alkaline non-lysosomal ceramidase N-terminal domain-containing protein [Spirochaetota bacterium]|nr:neutral/alkaline non-lysosomal ceramidase N-terminal domain-containing protein [Spirochaetota bacterium]
MTTRIARIIIAAGLGLGLYACSAPQVKIDIRNIAPAAPAPSDGLVAGAARVDITPPPGMPLAGYSKQSGAAEGFRTRLYARAIYIKPKTGKPIALVQCDLLSGSLILHHRVAELVAKETGVGADALMIAGTHTHSGPGGYFESNFYNRFAAAAPGFDRDYFDFLAGRIAAAIMEAHTTSAPAKVAAGTMDFTGFSRNRSIEAYRHNATVPEAKKNDIFAAVNPSLHMVRVDCRDELGRFVPRAAFSSYSIHATVIPNSNRLYNADVFAAVTREFERLARERLGAGEDFVHAAANGTHGDNSPNYRDARDFPEARRLGSALAARQFELFSALGAKLSDEAACRAIAREIDLATNRSIGGVSLASEPKVGNALLAGAPDGRTPVVGCLPFFAPGWPRWFFTGGEQGHKRIAAGPLQPIILPKEDFPHLLYLQLIQVGNTVLAPLPFEITTESGRRIAAQCASAFTGAAPVVVAPISVSNGYFGYVTTPEEYARQYYEGGHTLYGPNTQPFLAAHAADLARALINGTPSSLPTSWSFTLEGEPFVPKSGDAIVRRSPQGAPEFEQGARSIEASWRFRWIDAPPRAMAFDRPLVRIESSPDGKTWTPLAVAGTPMDDGGYDLSVRLVTKYAEGHLYEARWHNPARNGGQYRFVILPRAPGGEALRSASFK